MPVAVAFIRGINVGGKHKLPMADLRSLCEKIGWRDVATHINSGNVVFRSGKGALGRAGAAELENTIEKECGFKPGVVVRSLAEMRTIVSGNPFDGRDLDPSKLLVLFLAGPPDAGARDALRAIKAKPEEIELAGNEVFLHYPNGIADSKLPFTAVEKAVKVSGTTRNWNTITKVLAMAEALDAAA